MKTYLKAFYALKNDEILSKEKIFLAYIINTRQPILIVKF